MLLFPIKAWLRGFLPGHKFTWKDEAKFTDEVDVEKKVKKIFKNLKTFTGYIQLKISSFRLSSYSLQWIKMEKMTTTINTKIGETIKRIF